MNAIPASRDEWGQGAHARTFLNHVPDAWTPASKIRAPFVVLETLVHTGDIEMKTVPIYTHAGIPAGSLHFFRRAK
ncbi:hypothetical protein F3N42_03795 [Marinihelvus fidelis]|uniref:Uncharacterized protein n=1 Tax=Marinihelvus fidelis TaxID=2613842 RepID=A0A5N0TG75_9GAMM|nr:hypothetical protein [Marinihelvus fidelis]KAA9133484.1 hypothetical protein F3N42_03795 [Marinihelvus fidelis]